MKRLENARTAHIIMDFDEVERDSKLNTISQLSEHFADIRNTYGRGNILVHMLKPGEEEVTFNTATADVVYGSNGYQVSFDDKFTKFAEPSEAAQDVGTRMAECIRNEVFIPGLDMLGFGDALDALSEQAAGLEQ